MTSSANEHLPGGVRRAGPPSRPRSGWLSGPWPAVLAALLFFANSLGNRFAYDDTPIVEENSKIRDLSDWRAIWFQDWWLLREEEVVDPQRDRLYRPLTLFSFGLNYAVHGLSPLGFHLVNVLLHAAVSGLVWALVVRLLGDRRIASVAALLFAVHPVHVEAVANIVGRAEVLAALFLLLGLLTFVARDAVRLTPGRAAAAGALFLAALLSKETAICYPAVALLALHHRVRGAANLGWWLVRGVLVCWPLVVYFPLRLAALEGRLVRDADLSMLFNPLFAMHGWERVVGIFTVLGHYTRLLLAPQVLSADYGLAIIDPAAGFTAIAGLGVAAAVVIAVLLAGYFRPAGPWRNAAFLTATFLASYALISNALILIGVSLAERLMYWPSTPVIIALAVGACRLAEHLAAKPLGRVLPAAGAALLVVLGMRTATRNADWYDNSTLFEADHRTHPQAVLIAVAYSKVQLSNAARIVDPAVRAEVVATIAPVLDEVLRIAPRFPEALHQRAIAYHLAGELDLALRYFDRTITLNPWDSGAQDAAARIRATSGDGRAAELRAALTTRPADPRLAEELGRELVRRGDLRAALEELERAAARFPDDLEVQHALGELLALHKRDADARTHFERLLIRWPDDWVAHANLTTLYSRTDPGRALHHAQQAARLRPDDLRVRNNLAEALVVNQRIPEAIRLLRALARDLPADDPLRPAIERRILDLQSSPP